MENLFESSNCLTKTQIKKYLQKQMKKEHQLVVERHLVDCPLCSDAIDGYTNHYNFESDTTFENLENFLKEKETMTKSKTVNLQPQRSIRFNRMAAAILMFLIPISGFLYWNSQSMDRIFEDHFEPASNMGGIVRGEFNSVQVATLTSAQNFYNEKDFESSARLYSEFLEEFPENTNATFYAGVSNLEIGNTEKAVDLLTTARMNSTTHYEDATWYLVLANLKLENFEEAKILSTEVKSSRFKKKLEVLLKELK